MYTILNPLCSGLNIKNPDIYNKHNKNNTELFKL